MPESATQLSVRPYRRSDERAVLQLIEADRLPGQPLVTPTMLADALAGRSAVDSSWWNELDRPVAEVVQSDAGEVVGVVSYATRPTDQAGVILWLHCREDPVVATALIERALSQFASRTIHAFDFATALSLGLEGLPVRHRRSTYQAVISAGFEGEDLWRYMRADLPLPGLPVADVEVRRADDVAGMQLEMRRDGEVVAEATVGDPVDGIGVLWWISVAPAARGHRLGLTMLGSAVKLLAEHGADQVILYVDDDAPAGEPERDRAAANHMYDVAGLQEVDRLFSFRRDTGG